MGLFKPSERRFLEAVAQLAYCNHFLPERVEHEKAALGPDFIAGEPVWSASVGDPSLSRPNVLRIHEKLQPLINGARDRLAAAADVNVEDLDLYQDCVFYLLYQRFYRRFASANGNWDFYRNFVADWNHHFGVPGKRFKIPEPAHVFACFRQIQKAFDSIFDKIIGSSFPKTRRFFCLSTSLRSPPR